MSDAANKRKGGPGGPKGGAFKKSKGGNAGKWQTTHRKARDARKTEMGSKLEVGDAGIWVTYARGMKGKAMREFRAVCDQYGESLFGVEPPKDPLDGCERDEEDDGGDIEAAIEKELVSIKDVKKPRERGVFTPVSTGLECLFFMKTALPVDALGLVQKMCQDARDCPDPRGRKTKYINRLTPIRDMDKATENGIERVARSVLAQSFELKSEESQEGKDGQDGQDAGIKTETSACTYAIRHNIRNHTTFKSGAVIQKIAGMVSPKHKVNLGNPDKVVLVEIFQLYCGISVVDGKQWEELKRYNLNELYRMALDPTDKEEPADKKEPDAAPAVAATVAAAEAEQEAGKAT